MEIDQYNKEDSNYFIGTMSDYLEHCYELAYKIINSKYFDFKEWKCIYCESKTTSIHNPDCPIILARRILIFNESFSKKL